MVAELQHTQDGEQEQLGNLLRRCRTRIPPDCASLGVYLRLPSRVGKAVTQEEVAEVAGISRQWYWRMESNGKARVSASVLARIADVLMMSVTERAALFRLAVPELRPISMSENATEALDMIGSLRRFTRALWAATSEDEALMLAREHVRTYLGPEVAVTARRVAEGVWEYGETGAPDGGDRIEQFDRIVRDRWGGAAIDDLHSYTLISQPGDVITRTERNLRIPDLAAAIGPILDTLSLPNVDFATAQVRSRDGFVARLSLLHTKPHRFSEFECGHLSALAEITSLALQRTVRDAD